MKSFKEYCLTSINEKVSRDCSNGPGIIPAGPFAGYKVLRVRHLDFKRKDGKERDHGFDCETFGAIVNALSRVKGVPSMRHMGEYQIVWKNRRGYQAAAIEVNQDKKIVKFITIMQLNRKCQTCYHAKGRPEIYLGPIDEPKLWESFEYPILFEKLGKAKTKYIPSVKALEMMPVGQELEIQSGANFMEILKVRDDLYEYSDDDGNVNSFKSPSEVVKFLKKETGLK
jgi:hypothetical protein